MSDITVSGSGLCGSVKYTAIGETKRFYHCHCEHCRKATGSGHASNILITPHTSISWLQGEDKLSRYKVPEAESFYNCFCQNCGRPMPRVVPELDDIYLLRVPSTRSHLSAHKGVSSGIQE